MYDPTTPYIYGFAYPIALCVLLPARRPPPRPHTPTSTPTPHPPCSPRGNCLPVLGEVGMPIPPLMFSLSGAWVVVDRVSTISLRILDAPALGATADVHVAVSGLPEPAGYFSVWWWFSADGVALTGPLPSCAAVGVPLVAGSTAGAATATLPFDPELASANARFLTVALLPAAAAAGTQNLCGEAMTPLPGARLPPAIAGATLAFDVYDRATISQLPNPSPILPASPTPSPLLSLPLPPVSASVSSSRTPTRANFLEIRNTSGASRAAPAFAAAVVAFFAALCGAWLL